MEERRVYPGGGEIAGGRIRALDVEVEIKWTNNDPTSSPIWVTKLDDAIRWVSEVASDVFDRHLHGEVRLGNQFSGPLSYAQFLTVSVRPTQSHKDFLRGELQSLRDRLERDIELKFGRATHGVIVRINPEPTFFSAPVSPDQILPGSVVPTTSSLGGHVGVSQVPTGNGVQVIHSNQPQFSPYAPSVPVIVVTPPPPPPPPKADESKDKDKDNKKGMQAPPWIWSLMGALGVALFFMVYSNSSLRNELDTTKDELKVAEADRDNLERELEDQRDDSALVIGQCRAEVEKLKEQVAACPAPAPRQPVSGGDPFEERSGGTSASRAR